MDESFFRDKLSAYLDQELSPEEMAMMEEYVQSHPDAREMLEQLRQLDRLVDEQSQLGGDDYWERSARKIEAALGAEASIEVVDIRPESRWRGLGWRIAVGAASVVLLGYIGFHVSDIMPPEEVPPPSDRPAIEYRQESPREITADTMQPAADRIESSKREEVERDIALPVSGQEEGRQTSTPGNTLGYDELNVDEPVDAAANEKSPKIGIPKPVAEPAEFESPQRAKTRREDDASAGRASDEMEELPAPDDFAPLDAAELTRTKMRLAELVRKSNLSAAPEDMDLGDISLSAAPSPGRADTSKSKKAEDDKLYRRNSVRSLTEKYSDKPSSLAPKIPGDTAAAESIPDGAMYTADSVGTGLTVAEEAELADLSFKLASQPQKAGDKDEGVYLLRRLEEWGSPDTRKLARAYLARLGVPAVDR